jgi:hypothetical protein
MGGQLFHLFCPPYFFFNIFYSEDNLFSFLFAYFDTPDKEGKAKKKSILFGPVFIWLGCFFFSLPDRVIFLRLVAARKAAEEEESFCVCVCMCVDDCAKAL